MEFFLNILQIILIDLSLAADNALVIGMAVAKLPALQRRRATIVGVGAATILRIVLAFFAVQLLHVTGLMLAGGILLLWVCWKMYRDMRGGHSAQDPKNVSARFASAVSQIVIADISMSLDNVLAVAGVARDRMPELVIGLVLSVVLMGLASSQVARLTARYPKAVYVGIAVIFYAAAKMIYDGWGNFSHALV